MPWPPGSLHVERFTPKVRPAPAPDGGVRGGAGAQRAHADRAAAAAPSSTPCEAAGVEVLSSCREGTCGTCETAVLDGTPDHRDSLLTDEERAADDTMIICVSRCRGKRLVLDL